MEFVLVKVNSRFLESKNKHPTVADLHTGSPEVYQSFYLSETNNPTQVMLRS